MDKERRHYTMSRIRKTDTKPELKVRKYLFANGFRYRLYGKHLPGSPDIVLPKYKAVVLVNGCFWHAHEGCKLNRAPKVRPEYWIPKIAGNVERDKKNFVALEELGWKALVIWECELRGERAKTVLEGLIMKLTERLNEIY